MKKIRLLIDNKFDYNYWAGRMGPNVATFNDLNALKGVEWLVQGKLPLKEVIERDERPWYRLWNWPELLKEAEKLNIPLILGPNKIFKNATRPEGDIDILTNPAIERMLVLNENIQRDAIRLAANKLKKNIRIVKHALRPEIYNMPYQEEEIRWDVLILEKTNMPYSTKHLKGLRFKKLINGKYNMDELIYTAKRSSFCLMTSRSESFSLAGQEIASQGCPIIGHYRASIHFNTFIESENAIFLHANSNSKELFTEKDEMSQAISKARSLKRKEVSEATIEHLSYKNIQEIYRKAFYE